MPLYLFQVATEFGATTATIGLVAAISGFIYGAGSLLGGSLSDRLGEVKTITLSLAFAGSSTLIFIVARDLSTFSVALLLVGAGASLYHPTANSIISKVFQTNMAEAMGIHGTGGNVGYMFAPLVTVALGDLWGWRYPWIFFGLLSIIVSLLILKTSRISVKKNEVKVRLKDLVKVQGLPILLAFNMLAGLYYKGVDFIFPSFVETRFQPFFSKDVVSTLKGSAVFGMLAVGILGQWVGGKASDKFGSKKR